MNNNSSSSSSSSSSNNNNNNNNIWGNVYGAVITTQVIARVQPVHLTNAGHDVCLYSFLQDQIFFDTRYLVTESRATMGQDGSGPEFHINFGSGWVGSLLLWVGYGQVKQI